LTCLLFAAALVAANPYVETFLSEVGVDPARQFVELHCAPQSQSLDLSGWQIVTSTSVCTLTCELGYGEFLVVDSAALAEGYVGYGTIHLNPLGDSVMLVTDSGPVADIVHYPMSPTGYDSAPLPPGEGSIAFWNYDDMESQSLNWYVDSTPTPGEANDDFGVIAGSVTGTGGVTLDEVIVLASGRCGRCHKGLYHQTGYSIGGLGAGVYSVRAMVYHQGHSYQIAFPESVAVGYGQTVPGIDMVVPLTGVAEAPPAMAGWLRLVAFPPGTATIHSDRSAFVTVAIRDHLGRIMLKRGLSVRPGRTAVPLHNLAPGVYFVSCTSGQTTIRKKLVTPY
jgi:hypothetical protein